MDVGLREASKNLSKLKAQQFVDEDEDDEESERQIETFVDDIEGISSCVAANCHRYN
jgi:hypothetical protein